jgi:hypothetical protein
LTAFFESVISIHELDRISVEVGGFHCSSIDSMLVAVVVLAVVVLAGGWE